MSALGCQLLRPPILMGNDQAHNSSNLNERRQMRRSYRHLIFFRRVLLPARYRNESGMLQRMNCRRAMWTAGNAGRPDLHDPPHFPNGLYDHRARSLQISMQNHSATIPSP